MHDVHRAKIVWTVLFNGVMGEVRNEGAGLVGDGGGAPMCWGWRGMECVGVV
jgi:hypothetical protein